MRKSVAEVRSWSRPIPKETQAAIEEAFRNGRAARRAERFRYWRGVALLVIGFLVLASLGAWFNYSINCARFPNAPWWANFFGR